jgi:hypothetical protein
VLVTFVVRLLSDRLSAGELVGEVEHVGDGGNAIVRGAGDLLGFAQQVAATGATADAEAGDVPAATGATRDATRRSP